jgi:glycosyltransferase involved in cell wall biosynthesis
MGWIVSQYGARQHYATPRAFARRGTLDWFYTENWAGRCHGLLTNLPGRARAFANRWSDEVPDSKVVSFNLPTLFDLFTRRLRGVRSGSTEVAHQEYIREGARFCARVNRDLCRRSIDPKSTVFYGCKSVCLETLTLLNKHGIFSIVDQADPAAVEEKLVHAEREKWPGWEAMPGAVPQAYYDRCRAEWDAASMVLVYSDWTRQAIIDQGAPAEKVVVVPLAYEAKSAEPRPPRDPNQPFTVLWLGTVNLRKGIPYFLEAARLLKDTPIKFIVAGQINISEQAVKSAPANVEFLGRVIRGQAETVYRSADLFVLPTISDSFALTQVEAMANGLPVIATERCGKVVTPGVDGEIIPTADAPALAETIAKLAADRPRVAEMSRNALLKARSFSIDSYGQQVCGQVVKRRPDLAQVV